MSKVAVVILNYNGANYLKQFLPALIEFTSNQSQLIVADNHSTDNSVELIENSFQKIDLIRLPRNFGYAGGYNEALKQVQSDYFLLLNSDIEVTRDWLNPLVKFLDDHGEYAAVQPKILDWNERSKFEYAGAAGGYIDSLGYPYCKGRMFDTIEGDNGQYNVNSEIFWASGACFLVRSSSFWQVDGFDASFFAHMEEIDLCWRLKQLGLKIGFVHESRVFHVGGGTLAKEKPQKTYLNFRNNLFLLRKNESMVRLTLIIPARLILDTLAAVKLGLSHGRSHFTAVLRAYFAGLTTPINRTYTKTLSKQVISIVWQYYLLGKKTWDDLQ